MVRHRLTSDKTGGRRKRKRQEGFTLIEIMVAMLLLTILIVGAMATQISTIRTSSDARTSTSAVSIAQSRLEEFRSLPYANLAALGPEIAYFNYDTSPNLASSFFTRTTTVAQSAEGWLMTVVVQWTAQNPQQITMITERTPLPPSLP